MLIKSGNLDEILAFWPGSLVNISTRTNGKHIRIEREIGKTSEVFIGKVLFLNPFAYGNFTISARVSNFAQNNNHFTIVAEVDPRTLSEEELTRFSDNVCLSRIFIGISLFNLFFINYSDLLAGRILH